ELRRPRVGVADERREGVGDPVTALARVFVGGQPDVTPVNRDPHLVHLLPGYGHRPQPLGDEREDLELASLGGDADLVAALDALLARELERALDERLR